MLLDELYGDLARTLPSDEDAGVYRLTRDSVVRPPAVVESASITIEADTHQWDASATYDLIKIQAPPAEFRELGLLCLGVALHTDVTDVRLELTAPGSAIKVLRIQLHRDADTGGVGWGAHALISVPAAFDYIWDDEFDSWHYNPLFGYPEDKPYLQLSDATEISSRLDARVRDHVYGFGSVRDLCKVGELFMNFGAQQKRDSLYFFGDDLTRYSAELAIGLPGTDWSSI